MCFTGLLQNKPLKKYILEINCSNQSSSKLKAVKIVACLIDQYK